MKLLKILSDGLLTARLMALYAVVAASALAGYGLYKGADVKDIAALAGVFITAAFAVRALNKAAIKKEDPK